PPASRLLGDRERNLGPEAAVARQLERAAELVAHERPHDREAGAVRRAAEPAPVVRDREQGLAVAPPELDPHAAAAVLERIPDELGEDERERVRPLPVERDRIEVG